MSPNYFDLDHAVIKNRDDKEVVDDNIKNEILYDNFIILNYLVGSNEGVTMW